MFVYIHLDVSLYSTLYNDEQYIEAQTIKHKPFLELLSICKPAQQYSFLATATPEQVYCSCNCIQNSLRKRYVLPQKVIGKTRPLARHINKAADENRSVKKKKQTLVQIWRRIPGLDAALLMYLINDFLGYNIPYTVT